ncbi:protein of unknown function DUF1643 [Actinobacteria bacterium OV320]|nr:protein of unknown function DUF1643 [Actinobacteria bacterium OV320]
MSVLTLMPADTELDVHVEQTRDLAGGTAAAVFDSPARTYRYLLTRIWDPTTKPLVVLMLNPSTANALTDDPTIRRLAGPTGFARREQAGGVVVVNLFALCSPDPRDLARHPDPVGRYADVFIRTAAAMGDAVVVAWGAFPVAAERSQVVVEGLRGRGVRLLCLGTTSKGLPRHPLYLPGAAALEPYGVTA